MAEVKAVMRRDAYPDRLSAKVGAETKTLRNIQAAIVRQNDYLKSVGAAVKEEVARLKKERDESKARLEKAQKALADG